MTPKKIKKIGKTRKPSYDQFMKNEHSIVRFNLLTSLLSILNHEDEKSTSFLLAKYFLEHFQHLKTLSIYKVSEECYVSRSSIQRFVKQIGYESFTFLKESIREISVHQASFIHYTDHADFENYLMANINAMTVDINSVFQQSKIHRLVEKIHNASRVIILTAEDSISSIRIFQQAMLAVGKLIRVITSASGNHTIIDHLDRDDLLLVCSTTGNYALAINDEVIPLRAGKALITMNHTAILEDTYEDIYYLSSDDRYSSHTITSVRNIYTNYGMTYFFNLLYHAYFKKYRREIVKVNR